MLSSPRKTIAIPRVLAECRSEARTISNRTAEKTSASITVGNSCATGDSNAKLMLPHAKKNSRKRIMLSRQTLIDLLLVRKGLSWAI